MSQPSPIHIVLVDDHPLVLQGLEIALSAYQDIQVSGVYKNGQELLAGIASLQPDVLILDIHLPDIPGDELVPLLLDQYPDLKIMVLTNFDSTMYASKMQYLGVHGYLLKTTETKIVVEAVRLIYAGQKVMEKSIQAQIEQSPLRSQKILAAKAALTSREKQILQMISDGFTDPKIAETLFLSGNTVRHYRDTLLLKLDVNNTAAMVSKALKLGLVH